MARLRGNPDNREVGNDRNRHRKLGQWSPPSWLKQAKVLHQLPMWHIIPLLAKRSMFCRVFFCFVSRGKVSLLAPLKKKRGYGGAEYAAWRTRDVQVVHVSRAARKPGCLENLVREVALEAMLFRLFRLHPVVAPSTLQP